MPINHVIFKVLFYAGWLHLHKNKIGNVDKNLPIKQTYYKNISQMGSLTWNHQSRLGCRLWWVQVLWRRLLPLACSSPTRWPTGTNSPETICPRILFQFWLQVLWRRLLPLACSSPTRWPTGTNNPETIYPRIFVSNYEYSIQVLWRRLLPLACSSPTRWPTDTNNPETTRYKNRTNVYTSSSNDTSPTFLFSTVSTVALVQAFTPACSSLT